MSKRSAKSTRKEAPTRGRADLARLRRVRESEIERTSPPELRALPDDFWEGARIVVPPLKEAISIRLDTDVLEWFRATGSGYQSRINAVLRSYMEQVGKRVSR